MGASDYFAGNIEGLEVPQLSPPTLDWGWDVLSSLGYFFQNIVFFFTLMTVDAGVAWMGTLIFSPAIILLAYEFIKHILIPLIHAIGNWIPFT